MRAIYDFEKALKGYRVFRIARNIGRITLLASLASTAVYLYPAARLSFLYALPDTRDEASIEASLFAHGSEAISAEIKAALAENDPELAASFVQLAAAQNIDIEPALLAQIDEASRFNIGRSAGELWSGFVSGNADTPTAFAASLAADLSVAGDVRDLYREFSAYPNYDELTVGLAAVGLAATGATFASGFNALPAKAGVSLLKSAKKAGKISPPLAREMRDIAARSIDTKAAAALASDIRKLDATAALASIRRVVKPEIVERLGKTAASLGDIAGKQGYRGTLQTLELASSTGDISRLERISTKFGDTYRAVVRIAAKTGALSLKAAKFAALMAWWLGGMLVWLVGAFLVAADLVVAALRLCWRAFRRSPAATPHFSSNA